jgi:hypothetical protein
LFSVVNAKGFTKSPTDSIQSIGTDAERVVVSGERGGVQAPIVALADTNIRLVELEHADGVVGTGKERAIHPACRAASKTLYVATMLFGRTDFQGACTLASAAICTTASKPSNAGRMASKVADISSGDWNVRSRIGQDAVEPRQGILAAQGASQDTSDQTTRPCDKHSWFAAKHRRVFLEAMLVVGMKTLSAALLRFLRMSASSLAPWL